MTGNEGNPWTGCDASVKAPGGNHTAPQSSQTFPVLLEFLVAHETRLTHVEQNQLCPQRVTVL